jgi:hypothetical protein
MWTLRLVRFYNLHGKGLWSAYNCVQGGGVKKVVILAGEPLVVNELSLIKTGPVRVKIKCRNPHTLWGFFRIFFNGVGHNIRFVYENYNDNSSYPPSLPPQQKGS